MPESPVTDTTCLLRAWANGDSDALEQLTPRVYGELRRVAARRGDEISLDEYQRVGI